jgi:hypothetical protein
MKDKKGTRSEMIDSREDEMCGNDMKCVKHASRTVDWSVADHVINPKNIKRVQNKTEGP